MWSLLLELHRRRVGFDINSQQIELYTDIAKGESRTDLVGRNLKILGSAIEDMKPFREDTIIILVSNPVDILTYFAQKFSGLPKSQVIGSGTFLDSARLRGILAQKCGVAASSIDAYVLGEHGESQMVSLLRTKVSCILLANQEKGRMVSRLNRQCSPRTSSSRHHHRQNLHCRRHQEESRRHHGKQRRHRIRYRRRDCFHLQVYPVRSV